jgi:hypothetical protein
MSEPRSLMVNDVKYVREDSVPQLRNLSGEVRIVILQRGWVAVGYYSKSGSDVKLDRASIIRKWGTSKGLGELVSGPLSDTKLDSCGTLQFHELAVVATMDTEASKWAQHLK